MSQPREEEKNISGPAGIIGTGGGGSNDVSSGGGAGAGIPDADTGMSAGEAFTSGDPKKDRENLFPEAQDPHERPQEAIPPPKGG